MSDQLLNGRYQIIRDLGAGAFGQTFEAADLTAGTRVAIKKLSLSSVETWRAVERFEREVQVLASLEHPSIPRYRDSFQSASGTELYLIQDLAEGSTFAELIARGDRMDETGIRRFAEQVLEVLIYLHELNPPVFHRDLKPANLIRTHEGRVLLVDFGSVRSALQSMDSLSHSVAGTFGYMAPEQLIGQAGPATDLYGLGATMLHILTHRPPSDFPQSRLKLDFRRATSLPEPMERWLEVLLEPAPEDRFPSARAALDALNNGATALALAASPPVGSRIVVQRDGSQLVLDLRGPGFNSGVTALLVFSTFWLAFVALWTAGAWRAPFPLAILSIPFWFAGLAMMSSALVAMFGHTTISIDPDQLHFRRSVLGASWTKHARTRDIDRAEIDQVRVKDKRGLTDYDEIVIREGVHEHRFGRHLHAVEREWLVSTIARHLGRKR